MGWEYPLATLGMIPGYFQGKQRKMRQLSNSMTTNCVITQKVEMLVTACLWFKMIKNLVSLWPTYLHCQGSK